MKSLKELREHNNLKQREVAQHIGVSDRVYAYYEKGRTLPAKYVKPLANLFGIGCDEFLENTENPLVWEKEFGCIERTERLELPTWEESKECCTICCFDDVEFDYFVHDNTYCLYQDCYKLLDLEATKENYTFACRKAKELFLGEKK